MRSGHESHMIKKMRAKAGKPALGAAPKPAEVDDGFYDDYVPKKRVLQLKQAAAAAALAAAPPPHAEVANFGNARAAAAAREVAEFGAKRKRPSAIIKTDAVRDVWSETVPVLNPLLSNGQTTYETSKLPRVRNHDRRPNAEHILPVCHFLSHFSLTFFSALHAIHSHSIFITH